MSKEINVAVLGATGAVGQSILQILAEHNIAINNLYPLASQRSAGAEIQFKDKRITVLDVAEFDFSQVQYALFSAGGSVSAEYAPKAAACGCMVIDNTSQFRYDDDIPLIVPEINAELLKQPNPCNIIANPNCSTIQMLVALNPIRHAVGITRINVATYQAVSGSGQKGINALAEQSQLPVTEQCNAIDNDPYPKPIAFNVIPHIDVLQENGYSREEMKMVWETQKIFADTTIQVNPTAVRVPVYVGHAEAVHIETKQKISAQQAKTLLATAPGVVLCDAADTPYACPRTEAASKDAVFVGRVREDISHPLGLDLWVVADNVRKGAALNAVQILEYLNEHV